MENAKKYVSGIKAPRDPFLSAEQYWHRPHVTVYTPKLQDILRTLLIKKIIQLL